MSVILPRLVVTFSAIDVPDEVQAEVMRLLLPYDPDIYERAEARQVSVDSESTTRAGAV